MGMEIKYVTTHYIDVDKKYPKYSKDIVDFSLDIDGEETFKRYFKEHIENKEYIMLLNRQNSFISKKITMIL